MSSRVTITLTCDADVAQWLLAIYDLLMVDSFSAEDASDFTASVSQENTHSALTYLRDKLREVYVDAGNEGELARLPLFDMLLTAVFHNNRAC